MKRFIQLKYLLVAILFINFTYSKVFAEKFYSINSLFGISIRVTNSICKDDNGFIWASSKTGILRLADDDYRIYNLPYETAGAIVVKLIYENSKLTASTNNGQIFQYNQIYDRFDLLIDLSKSLHIKHFDMHNLLMDPSGDYWIALNNGLYKYHPDKLPVIEKVINDAYSISWFDEQHLIIADPEGISMLNTQSLVKKSICKTSDINGFTVSTFFFDKGQNKLWMGTFSNGLFCFHLTSNTLTHILPSRLPRQPILAIEENSSSTLLIGIDGQGIWEVNKQGAELLNVFKESADDPNSLRGNGVYDIFCDPNKRVWIATISGGISFMDQASPLVNQLVHRTNNSNSLINNDVNGIIEDRYGKIWYATNNGISCWNPLSDQWKNYYCNELEHAQVFLSLCEDDQGRIWAGSYSSGVYVLDAKNGRELAHYSSADKALPTISNFIFDIFKDSQGDLWIGGINGELICYQSKENKFRAYSNEPISSLAELSPNQILVGCSYGILILNKQTGEIKSLLSNIVVQDLLLLGDEIWICTSGEGLVSYNYKTQSLTKFTALAGLPSNFINSIVYADHFLWLGTEGGLCRFDPTDQSIHTFSSIFPLSVISYNKSAVSNLKNGKLVWGTSNGAVIFTPESLKENPSKGRIFFQDLTVSGRSVRDISNFQLTTPVDQLQSIQLKYFQNTINLDLLPIGISSGAKFSWKLEGFDKDWSPSTNNRIITYTNIPSGPFTLKIKLLDNSLAHVIGERFLQINVIPPFWRTGWFSMLLSIVVLGILFLFFMYYINRLKQHHTEEKVRFFTNTSHDIRTSLTLIKAPIEELRKEEGLSEKGQSYLHIAIEQARQLSSVVTQLMDFQKVDIGKEQLMLSMLDVVNLISNRRLMFESFAKSKNIELAFVTDCQSYITAIDELKIEKIIDNLISNAIKYSPENNQIQIDLKCETKKWTLQVKDNGIGISRKAQRQLFKEFYRGDNAINSKVVGSGIGLLLVKNYVSMHGGTINCNSQENVGSTFQVVIPSKEIAIESKSINAVLNNKSAFIKDMDLALPTPSSTAENHNSKEMRILIVEDNDELRRFMEDALSHEFSVSTAEDGVMAWEMIRKQLPDMVVSDVMMPNRNGYELCQLMKSTYETSHIPLILLTALTEKTEQLHGLGLGADDYLTKPFDMSLLVQRIKTITRNRERIKEKAYQLIKGGTADPQLLENEHNDKFIKKILEVARANISNIEFDKEVFAASVNMSSSLLYKKTKSLTGLSPTDFIKIIRLDHSLELLQTRKHTVTEVSELCGFASVGYFSTVFKKHFGKSPTDLSE